MSTTRVRGLALLARRAAAASQGQVSSQPTRTFAAAADSGSDAGPPVVPVPLRGRGGVAVREQAAPHTAVRRQPDGWTEVVIQEGPDAGQVYYWNEISNETTAIGEPRPTALGRVYTGGQVGGRQSLGSLVAMGAGVGLAFGFLGKLLGG